MNMTEEEKQKRREYYRRWRESHKDYFKEYRESHKDYLNETNRKWNESHKDYLKEYHRKWNESKKQPVVYQYIELNSNKLAYIGSTNNLCLRVIERKCKNRPTRRVQFDNMYCENPDNYKLEIIKECETIEDARELEKHLIKELQPLYNITYK